MGGACFDDVSNLPQSIFFPRLETSKTLVSCRWAGYWRGCYVILVDDLIYGYTGPGAPPRFLLR